MIIAERTDTAVPITLTLVKFGLVTGATVEASIYDPATGNWLGNWTSGAWQPSKATQVLTENAESAGRYTFLANVSSADVNSTHFDVFFEVTAGGEGASQEQLVLVGELYDISNGTDQSAVLADTAAMQPAVAANLDAPVSTLATSAALTAVASEVTDILVDTSSTLPAYGDANWSTASGFAAPGDPMTLDPAAVDAIWEEAGADHTTAGTMGFLQDQAATGGAGVTPLQIEQAVWGTEQATYQDPGTMGRAVADSAQLPEELVDAQNRYFQTVRRYGPIAAKQPIATRDEVHAEDEGIIITIPVVLDGAYADLSQATSILFDFQSPDNVVQTKSGLGVTTPTGSYTTITTDETVFDMVGRWRVQATVTWPDLSTKSSEVYTIDVQTSLPAL